MAKKEFYKNGEGPAVKAMLQSPDEIEKIQSQNPLGSSPSREKLRLTRFPVSMEELKRLKSEVATAQPSAREAKELAVNQQDESVELEAEPKEEVPELGILDSLAPAILASFPGIQQTAFRPPDCTIAAGPLQVVVAVNTTMAIYSKSGTLQTTWQLSSLFAPIIPPGARIFDPKVVYDHYNGRWIVMVDSTRASPQGAWIMIAVSQTNNPAGAYWVWALDATQDGSNPSSNWADYSQLGFDFRAVYITNNMFKFGGNFSYVKIRILNKSQLYSGGSVQWYDFWNIQNPNGSIAFTLQPAVHYTGVGGNPPAYFVNTLWPSGNTITKWTLNNPLGFWGIGGPPSLSRVAVNCIQYDLAPDAQQSGTVTPIETNDSRLLNAIYQFSSSGEKRLWTCHTTKHTWPGSSSPVSVVQWYEIDVNTNNVIQQGRYGASNFYYYFPAIQTNSVRDAFIVFSRSSAGSFGELRETGRRSTATLNTLEPSALIKVGESAYTGGRWGDYFGICRDPSDTRRVWMNGEYAESGNTWGTWTSMTQ